MKMNNIIVTTASVFALTLIVPLSVQADTIVLKSGDVLNGRLIGEDTKTYKVELPYAGTVSLEKEGVISITKGKQTTDTSAALKSTLSAVNKSVGLAGVGSSQREAKTYGDTYEYESRVAGAGAITDGNSNTSTYHLDGELIARNRDNRYTARGEHNFGEAEGIRNTDDTSASLKYDRFLSKKHYAYTNLGYLRDNFQDLDGRYSAGVGVGYEVFNTGLTSLDIEAGPSLVHEDFSNGNKEDFPAGRWAVDFEQTIVEDRLVFFHLHEGLVSLKDSKDLVIQSETGVYLPVTKHWEARVQVNSDWDNSPAAGRENFDSTYLAGFGYRW